MRLFYTERFRRSYADAPLRVQKQCDKQLSLLGQDLRHPSESGSTATPGCVIFAIGVEFAAYPGPEKAHSQEWLCYSTNPSTSLMGRRELIPLGASTSRLKRMRTT